MATSLEKPQEIPLSIDEFCERFSKIDRRTVLLSGFHFEMRRAGRLMDTESNYKAAFSAFVVAPA